MQSKHDIHPIDITPNLAVFLRVRFVVCVCVCGGGGGGGKITPPI